MAEKKEYVIEVNKAIEAYNAQNPDKEELTIVGFAKKANCSAQVLSNYQHQKAPKAIQILVEIQKISGLTLEELIIEKE